MKRKEQNLKLITLVSITLIVLTFLSGVVRAQENKSRVSDGWEATLDALPKPMPEALGYPSRSPDLDVLEGFRNPPNGYGEVPFFWWPGDKLTRERLSWELDKLQEAKIQGFTVAYNHSHRDVDLDLNRVLTGQHGRTDPGDPPVFSDEWWEIWGWFSGECSKRGLGLGFKDYTFNLSGYWHDKIREIREFKNYNGHLDIRMMNEIEEGESFNRAIEQNSIVSLLACPVISDDEIDITNAIDLLALEENGFIRWTAPKGSKWRIYESVSTTDEAYMLHPNHGKEHINNYFQQFENRMDSAGRKGLNYFLQDELGPPAIQVGIGSWSEDFPTQFLKRKGYDIVPFLPALVINSGSITSKVRLDYFDVVVSLAEERFYKPIFDWHWQRGLIYGVDNYGRGLNPTAYGDYFRVTRWFTAPGNDAPGRGESFIQTKTSSSIAHLYQRPRVWLEAFHSIGWDTRPDELTEQIDRHYLFGGNFLNLHGLYYTLHGGWWEWAPPCFHFRMPYWPHFKYLTDYTERLSYLLSQGRHVTDVAIIYPVSPMQVDSKHKPKIAFETGENLFNAGIDFNFMDYQSLARAEVRDGSLHVADSKYPVLVLADLPSVRFTTLTQALAHFRSGGIVLAVGELPSASDRAGSDDPEVNKIVNELFGILAAEARDGQPASPQRNAAGGLGWYLNSTSDLASVITDEIIPDFISPSGKGKVLHRRVGFRDVYSVMDAPQGEECFFRAKGKAELWNAWTGEVSELPVTQETNEGTFLQIPNAAPRSSLIVFSPGQAEVASKNVGEIETHLSETITLDSIWNCEFFPTMDNRWGDFRIPASDELIGVEARELQYMSDIQSNDSWNRPADEDSWPLVRNTFGPQMYKLYAGSEIDFEDFINAAKKSLPDEEIVKLNNTELEWEPYEFSWRWGVIDQPGSQGWHGLKERVDNRFLILENDGHFIFRTTLTVKENSDAKVLIEGEKPALILINGNPIEANEIRLQKGTNQLFFAFRNIQGKGLGPGSGITIVDKRPRSSVVFVSTEEYQPVDPPPLSMKWHDYPGLLQYDFFENQPLVGYYRFLASPGLQGMYFKAFGQVECRIDGKPVSLQSKEYTRDDESMEYNLALDTTHSLPVWVDFRVKHLPGYYGGAAFPEPIKIRTGTGKINIGDWSKMGVLQHYSGGIRYKKTFNLTANQSEGRVILDLGEVIATCELLVNSKSVGVLINSPFTVDISEYLQAGTNHLDILVYNTLSNQYQTTPSPYKGNPKSGLIGPVNIKIEFP